MARPALHSTVIVAGGFDAESASAIPGTGDADLVALSRHFIANPHLPERLRNGWPLNLYERPSFFGGTEIAYSDYPTYAKAA